MLINRFVQTSTELWLEVLSSRLLNLLRGIGFLALGLGISGVIYAFIGPAGSIRGVALYGGFGVLFLGQLLFWLRGLLQGIATRFRFDLTAQTLYIENTPGQYEFLPKTLALADIRALRFLVITPLRSASSWQLELLMEDGTFYPLTVFKDQAKAQAVARQLQMALGKPLQEIAAPADHSFGAYKAKFLGQFQPSATDAKV